MGLFGKDRDLNLAPSHVELVVSANDWQHSHSDFEIRLDSFLVHHLAWRSRTSIQDLIKTGHVLIDPSRPDRPHAGEEPFEERRPGRRLQHGSRVIVVIPEELRPVIGPATDELTVLYDDSRLLAVDKPAGVVVHPSGRHVSDTLIQRVHARYGGGFELEKLGAPRLCHRLDRETSGIVLVALDPIAHADAQQQFERREVEKEYLTIVWGNPDRESGIVDLPIGTTRVSSIALKMTVAADGQPCRTDWRVVERFDDCALVACHPLTGRQHQIRVHMHAIGHPVVGDKLYGVDEALFERSLDDALTAEDHADLGLDRHALHNHRLVFRTTRSRERVEVTSPMPDDMQAFLDDR
jgi:23S rRNA pseudouridine1911/1915/1917 synthase